MQTRQPIEPVFDMQKIQESGLETSLLGTSNACAPERNLRPNDPLLRGSTEEGKEGRREKLSLPSTQVALNESYKAQISHRATQSASAKVPDAEAHWKAIQQILASTVEYPAYITWIVPCQLKSLTDDALTLATSTEFSRNLIFQRYRNAIKHACQEVLGRPVRLHLVVDKTLEEPEISPSVPLQPSVSQPQPTDKPKYQMAKFQNPTNNPEVAGLLERYGDMRGVILKCPIFKEPCTPYRDGGWEIGIGAMINACKQYTLERVIWAIRQTKAYRGANDRGKFFYHALRKGLEEGKY